MPVPNVAPDYIPSDLRSLYNVLSEEGQEDLILEMENTHAPKAGALITPEAQYRDPFSSFSSTPAQQAELKRTEDRRMGLNAGVLEQRAKEDVERLRIQQQEQALSKILTGNPETFYDTIIEKGVIENFDPALEAALKRGERDIYQVLSKEETKAFRTKLLMDLDAGVDPMTAQQNAYVKIQEIKRAERVATGFTSPPVKSGDTRMIDPSFGQGAQPTLGDAFGRQVYKTEEQVEQEKIRKGEADRIKSQLYTLFANQAVGEFTSQGVQPTNQEIVKRADQIESDYVQGKLLTDFVVEAKDDYMRAKQITEDEFKASPEFRKEATELANYLYNDFVYNIYPEYSGAEPEEPSFLKEVMTSVGDEGALVESRTGQALRGLGGLIRPVTEAVSDAISYEVVTDPVTGEVTYPEGTPLPLQQPMNVTKERSEMSYGDLIASDIAGGRFLGEDYAQMPELTKALGDEGAMILGLVTEIGLPITPVGMVAPLVKGTAVGARLTAGSAELAGKLLEKAGLDTAAKFAGKTSEGFTGADQHLQRLAQAAEQPITEVANYAMERKANNLRNDMNLTPDLIDGTRKKVAKELEALYKSDVDESEKIIKTKEMLDDLDRLATTIRKETRPAAFPSSMERGLSDALARVGAELKPEARSVYNDIMTTHRLLNTISNEAASGAKSLTAAASDTPYFRKIVQASLMDMLHHGSDADKALAQNFMTSKYAVPPQKTYQVIARNLANIDSLPRIKASIVEDYIRDYTFNMLPENFIFISPKAVVSSEAYRKVGPQVMKETNFFVQSMEPKIVGNNIQLTLDDNIADTLKVTLRMNYGQVAKSKMFKDLLRKVKTGTIEFTQQEFNLIQGAIKEQRFAEKVGVIAPQRATLEAIKRADVPMPRRKELARLIRTVARDIFPDKIKGFFNTDDFGYTKATQYGLARALQATEQEFSNFTIRLQQKAQRSLAANGGDPEASMNSLLSEAKEQMGFTNNQEMFYDMIKRTFDTQGISDDVLQSFIFNRVNNESLDFVTDFNKLYDEFLVAYPSKEAGTVGGKIIERKNTAVTFVETIAEGEKQAITRRIYADMERTFPDMFFQAPPLKAARPIPFEESPAALQKKVAQAEQDLAQMKVNTPEVQAELEALYRAADEFDFKSFIKSDDGSFKTGNNISEPLSAEAKLQRQAVGDLEFDVELLNRSISRSVVNAIAPSEINKTALEAQKRYINALISDLYEGSNEAIRYAYGELAIEGQGFLGTNVARALITPENVQKVKAAMYRLNVDKKLLRSSTAYQQKM